MNTNCNTALPDNAINVGDVEVGMSVRAAFSGERGVVKSIMRVGAKRLIRFEGGGTLRCNTAGTLRLIDVPEGYGYHYGHGCIHDW